MFSLHGRYHSNILPARLIWDYNQKCWVLWSLVVFSPDYDLTQNKSAINFNGFFSKA